MTIRAEFYRMFLEEVWSSKEVCNKTCPFRDEDERGFCTQARKCLEFIDLLSERLAKEEEEK
jgi:hypothetical protein